MLAKRAMFGSKSIRKAAVPVLALAALGVAGCANPQAEQAVFAQQALIGIPKETLLACAGVPERQAVVDNLEYFTYDSERITTRPGFGYGGFGGGFTRGYYGGFFGDTYADTETRSCKATFTLKNGAVTQVVYGGASPGSTSRLSQCFNVVENCLALMPGQVADQSAAH